MARTVQRVSAAARPLAAVLAALALLSVPGHSPGAPFAVGRSGGSSRATHGSRRMARRAVAKAEPEALQAYATLNLIKAQNNAGFAMKELGSRLQETQFEATSLDGQVRVAFNGVQGLQTVDLSDGALEAAGGSNEALAQAVLVAMQEAHDSSVEGTSGDVWQLYQENGELLQAPLNQLGMGNTGTDLWANVSRTDETVSMTEEFFTKFDVDGDGFWNWAETAKVQMATEGLEMAEEAFNGLVIAAAPNGGRNLTEEDMQRGLSKDQIVELYTDASRQRQLGFVLDIYKDYAIVFNGQSDDEPSDDAAEAPAKVAPSVD